MVYSKYGAKKTVIDGIVFDSKREAERYAVLRLLERAGKIKDLKLQQEFILIPHQKDEKGKVIEKKCSYFADFVYFDCELNRLVVEDAKGCKTKEYIIKRKLMLNRYGIRIKEV